MVPPKKKSKNWVAYAYLNSKESFYNDKWCGSLSALTHEVGHSIGFGHSGEIENGSINKYGDQSGMMGYSYNNRFIPRMCFNAAKNYQTNWFRKQKAYYDPMNGDTTKVTAVMNGIVDYTKYTNKYVTIRLIQKGTDKDFYIGYNRKKSYNTDTQESQDSITILEKNGSPGLVGASSTKVATLTLSTKSYTINNWGGDSTVSVVVKLESITNNNDDAKITITTNKSISPTEQMIATTCTTDTDTLTYRGVSSWNCEWVGSSNNKRRRRCNKSHEGKSITNYWCCATCK